MQKSWTFGQCVPPPSSLLSALYSRSHPMVELVLNRCFLVESRSHGQGHLPIPISYQVIQWFWKMLLPQLADPAKRWGCRCRPYIGFRCLILNLYNLCVHLCLYLICIFKDIHCPTHQTTPCCIRTASTVRTCQPEKGMFWLDHKLQPTITSLGLQYHHLNSHWPSSCKWHWGRSSRCACSRLAEMRSTSGWSLNITSK